MVGAGEEVPASHQPWAPGPAPWASLGKCDSHCPENLRQLHFWASDAQKHGGTCPFGLLVIGLDLLPSMVCFPLCDPELYIKRCWISSNVPQSIFRDWTTTANTHNLKEEKRPCLAGSLEQREGLVGEKLLTARGPAAEREGRQTLLGHTPVTAPLYWHIQS